MQSTTHLRAFHQAAWNEPLLHEQTSPDAHRSTVHYLDPAPMDGPARWAMTWRAWKRKHGGA